MATKHSAKIISHFEQTLLYTTSIKLGEVEKQRLEYQAHIQVLEEANKPPKNKDSLIKKVELLTEAIKSWGRLQFWIEQARYDPSFNMALIKGWAETLETHIQHMISRFDFAKLFLMLCNEWAESRDSSALAYQGIGEENEGSGGTTSDSESEYVNVEMEDVSMEEVKEKLVSMIFEDHPPMDADQLTVYLEELFAPEEAARALAKVRNSLHSFGCSFQRSPLAGLTVERAITGLLASASMNEEQRAALTEFQKNERVLQEIAGVLNLRLANLESWSWPKHAPPVEIRRQTNKKLGAFLDPEIINAIFLQYVGVPWQVQLKSALRDLFDSKAWKRPSNAPGYAEKVGCIDQFRELWRTEGTKASIDSQRAWTRRGAFFLNGLHETASVNRCDGPVDTRNEEEKKILHVMAAECRLNHALHGSHTMIQAELKCFGYSLPHWPVLIVLAFFGVPQTWLSFFEAFLATPTRLPEDETPRIRKRGLPTGCGIGAVCSEVLLFVMDFAVNQRADGLFLYRLEDNIWLWDADVKKCLDGWNEVQKFGKLVGMKFDDGKTGAAYVGAAVEGLALLPKGDIRWGFLKFDVNQTQFVIDQKEVDFHIAKFRRRLQSTKSVFGWINMYNQYMAYFLERFGGIPANGMGNAHPQDVIATFTRIQHELFPDTKLGAHGYLRNVIAERFGIQDIPDGYFYFPIAYGGLDLKNVMLGLFSLQKFGVPLATFATSKIPPPPTGIHAMPPSHLRQVGDAPVEEKFLTRIANDEREYQQSNRLWDTGMAEGLVGFDRVVEGRGEFMSFEEYKGLRECWLPTWGSLYMEMLQVPKPKELALLPAVGGQPGYSPAIKGRHPMNWYEKWVISLFGEEVMKKFGRLDIVDEDLIPLGLIKLLSSE